MFFFFCRSDSWCSADRFGCLAVRSPASFCVVPATPFVFQLLLLLAPQVQLSGLLRPVSWPGRLRYSPFVYRPFGADFDFFFVSPRLQLLSFRFLLLPPCGAASDSNFLPKEATILSEAFSLESRCARCAIDVETLEAAALILTVPRETHPCADGGGFATQRRHLLRRRFGASTEGPSLRPLCADPFAFFPLSLCWRPQPLLATATARRRRNPPESRRCNFVNYGSDRMPSLEETTCGVPRCTQNLI